MAYTKSFDPEKYRDLLPHLEEIRKLNPGDRYIIDCRDRASVGRVRYLLYNWLFHAGMKNDFTIKTHLTDIVVFCNQVVAEGGIVRKASMSQNLDTILEEMIKADNPWILLGIKLEEEAITPQEMTLLVTRYREVMG